MLLGSVASIWNASIRHPPVHRLHVHLVCHHRQVLEAVKSPWSIATGWIAFVFVVNKTFVLSFFVPCADVHIFIDFDM